MITAVGPVTVVTPGTLVRVWTPPAGDPKKAYLIHGVMFQAFPENEGIVYIGQNNLVRATMTGIRGMVGTPSRDSDSNVTALPSVSFTHTIAPNGLLLNDFYIDADNAGDGVIVTVLVT